MRFAPSRWTVLIVVDWRRINKYEQSYYLFIGLWQFTYTKEFKFSFFLSFYIIHSKDCNWRWWRCYCVVGSGLLPIRCMICLHLVQISRNQKYKKKKKKKIHVSNSQIPRDTITWIFPKFKIKIIVIGYPDWWYDRFIIECLEIYT